MDLGKPISDTPTYNPDAAPRGGFDQGEHGAGTGLSGGHGIATSQNTQAGRLAQDDSFNAGLGGQHASGGLPSGTPIADKFTNSANQPDPYGQNQSSNYGSGGIDSGSGNAGRGLSGERLDNSLDHYSGERQGQGQGYGGVGSGDAVSGAYSGGGTRDGLTGHTGHSTGAGVGVLGENLHGQEGHHHHQHEHRDHPHGARDAALAGTAGAAAVGAGVVGSKEYDQAYGHSGSSAASAKPLDRAEGVAGLGGGVVPGVGGIQGSGIGPNDSEGERYSTERRDPGYGNAGGANSGSGIGSGAAAVGTGLGAGAAAGAYGAGQQQQSSGAGGKIAEGGLSGSGGQGVQEAGTGGGKYGRASTDSSTGKPLSDPKDLDTGNPHSLVLGPDGQYVHRRDLPGNSGSTPSGTGHHSSTGASFSTNATGTGGSGPTGTGHTASNRY